jgi:hypothetical protein
MGKTVPMASFRRASRPTESAVAAFVELGDAPGDTPTPGAALLEPSNEVKTPEAPESETKLHVSEPARSLDTKPTVAKSTESETKLHVSEPARSLDTKPTVSKSPAKWRRKTLLRADGRELRKQTIYLEAELSHRLMVACAEKQYELSEAIEEAVNFWLKRKG